jgi:type II secretory pathway pseudopilin PulG
MSQLEQQNPTKKSGLNTLVIILLLAGIGVMTFLWSSTKSELSESNEQMATMEAMLSEYSGEVSKDLTSDLKNMLETYNALEAKAKEQGNQNSEQAAEIEAQKAQIKELLEKVEKGKWTASELAKMRRENETLRGIMKGYVHQIDSLNTLNLRLTSDLDETRTVLTTTTSERDTYKQDAEESKARVKEGSKLQAYGFSSGALRSKLNNTTTETDKAKNAVQIRSSFSIGANPIADKGNKSVYMQITKPDGTIFQSRTSNVVSTNQGSIAYSDKKDVDYTGEAVSLAIYYDLRGEEAQKGNYSVKIYCDGNLIGKDSFTLK